MSFIVLSLQQMLLLPMNSHPFLHVVHIVITCLLFAFYLPLMINLIIQFLSTLFAASVSTALAA